MERVDPVSVAAPHAVTTSRSEVVAFLIMVAFLVVAPFFVSGVGYDVFRDFTPVAWMVGLPTVLIAAPQLGLNSMRDSLALARSKSRRLNYAHTGRGTASHIHKMFKLPDGSLRLIVQGLARLTLNEVTETRPYLRARVTQASEGLEEADDLRRMARRMEERTFSVHDVKYMAARAHSAHRSKLSHSGFMSRKRREDQGKTS